MKEYHIRPIPLTKGPRAMPQFTHRLNYDKTLEICYIAWYIEGSDPPTMVDTGATGDMVYGRLGIKGTDFQTLDEGLAKLGLKYGDIGRVILTHLHWDHCAFAKRFTNAKFYVQKAELDFAPNPHPYIASSYEKEFFQDLPFEVVEGEKTIDEGISVFLSPGHTPGGQSVVINTAKGKAVIPGFCSIMLNFSPPPPAKLLGKEVRQPGKGMTVTPPGLHINVLEVCDSAMKVKEKADIILAPHDTCFVGVESIG